MMDRHRAVWRSRTDWSRPVPIEIVTVTAFYNHKWTRYLILYIQILLLSGDRSVNHFMSSNVCGNRKAVTTAAEAKDHEFINIALEDGTSLPTCTPVTCVEHILHSTHRSNL